MPCPKCGQPTQPSDKFCNSCGFSLANAGAPAPEAAPQGWPGAPPPASPFGAPPPAQPASPFGAPPPQPASPFGAPPPPPSPFEGGGGGSPYGPPPGAVPGGGFPPPPAAPGAGGPRCAQGHDIVPGQSYCREGHPIALDAMNFGSDMYGAPAAAPPPYAAPPFGAPPAYGAPPQSPFVGSPFGGPPTGGGPSGIQPPQAYGGGLPPAPPPFGDIPPSPPLGGAPFGGGPPQPFGAPPMPPPGPPGPFGGPPVGYGQPPPQQPQYGLRAPLTGGGPTNMLRGFLISFQSNPQGDFWPLFGGRLQVGRANTGELDIPLADATISSRHASLVVDGPSGTIFVEDTGSTNGTYVNDENIGPNGRRELRDGDRLRFGGYTTLVKVIGPLQ